MGNDEFYMREALKDAVIAANMDEVPVGAVIVKDGEIIARAHNLVETTKRSDAHAEMLALAEAEAKCGKWLPGATLYVTLEPCSMCAGAMILARIDRLVYGASDTKAGACGSTIDVPGNESLNHRIEITSGVLQEECSEILKEFFRNKRRRTT